MWMMRSMALEGDRDSDEVDLAQFRSKPLEKYLPCASVIRAEPGVDCELTSDRADRMEEMKIGLRRC